MYAIYDNIYHQYTPVMLAYIPYIQCEAPKIAKLVNITPMSLWFMALITIVFLGLLLTN